MELLNSKAEQSKEDLEQLARRLSREQLDALGPFADIGIFDRHYGLESELLLNRVLRRASRRSTWTPPTKTPRS